MEQSAAKFATRLSIYMYTQMITECFLLTQKHIRERNDTHSAVDLISLLCDHVLFEEVSEVNHK